MQHNRLSGRIRACVCVQKWTSNDNINDDEKDDQKQALIANLGAAILFLCIYRLRLHKLFKNQYKL